MWARQASRRDEPLPFPCIRGDASSGAKTTLSFQPLGIAPLSQVGKGAQCPLRELGRQLEVTAPSTLTCSKSSGDSRATSSGATVVPDARKSLATLPVLTFPTIRMPG